jgi:hypothetical protein
MPTQLPYIICTAVLILLNIGPLVWQFKQGNSGPIAMGVWIMVGSIHELVSKRMSSSRRSDSPRRSFIMLMSRSLPSLDQYDRVVRGRRRPRSDLVRHQRQGLS